MKMQNAITFVVAAVFLLGQTLGVAGHCVVDKMASQHAHHHAADTGHTHTIGMASDRASENHVGTPHHLHHSTENQNGPAPDLAAAFGDCTMGFAGVEPNGVKGVKRLHLTTCFSASIGKAMEGATPAQPTPPPNSIL